MEPDRIIAEVLPTITTYGVRAAGALVALWVAFRIASVLQERVTGGLQRRRFDATLSIFFGNLTRWLVLTASVLAVLSIFGIETTSFAAVLGAAGLAVGLGFQGTLSNFSAGVMLLVFRPFKVGDIVVLSSQLGVVKEIGLFVTAIDTLDGRRVILVINGLPSMRARAEESERLMEWAFREFEAVTLYRAQDTVEDVPVYLGERRTVPMVGGRDITLTLPRRWRDRLEVRVRYQAPLTAPVMRGQTIGELQVAGQGVPTLSVPLVAGADVEKLGLLLRIPAVIGRWVSRA